MVWQIANAGASPAATPNSFQFYWKGRSIHVEVQPADAAYRVRVDSNLGPVPYSIENLARRRAALAMHGIGRLGRFTIDRHSIMHHYVEIEVPAPLDRTGLVTLLVKLLLAVEPAYDRAAGWAEAA